MIYRFEAVGSGGPVVYERNAETGETIATFANGHQYVARVPSAPENGNISAWLRAATVGDDGLNWRRLQDVTRKVARAIEEKASGLRLFEFSCGCQQWARVYMASGGVRYGKTIKGCSPGIDPSNALCCDGGSQKATEIAVWWEQNKAF